MRPTPFDVPGGIPPRRPGRRRDEAVHRGVPESAAELRTGEIEQRLAVPRHERVDVQEPRDPVRDAVGDRGDDHAAVALPDEHDIVEVVELEVLEHVLDVRPEVDGRRGEMTALAEPGQRRPRHLVTLGL
jgi:hypothetical protein